MKKPTNGSWHLEKSVPVSMIVAIMLQTLAMVWWAARIEGRVSSLEAGVVLNVGLSERLTHVDVGLSERLTRVEVTQNHVLATIAENRTDIKNILSLVNEIKHALNTGKK